MTQQITENVNDVCKSALYISGLLARNKAAPSEMITESIVIFNDIIDELNGSGITIPSLKRYQFSMIAGTSEYHFTPDPVTTIAPSNEITSNLIVQLENVQITQSDVEYPVDIIKENDLKYNSYTNSTTGRPYYVWLEKFVTDGAGTGEPYSKLTFYPVPDTTYTVKISAKTQIDHVVNAQVLDTIPPQMRRFFKYAIARELCQNYQLTQNWTAIKESKYQDLLNKIMPMTDYDLTIESTDMLRNRMGNYNRRLLSV